MASLGFTHKENEMGVTTPLEPWLPYHYISDSGYTFDMEYLEHYPGLREIAEVTTEVITNMMETNE